MSLIKEFEQYLLEKDLSQNTISCYLRDVEQLEGWSSNSQGLGVGELAQINLTHFRQFLKLQYSNFTTINRKIASINSFYTWFYSTHRADSLLQIKPFKDKDIKEFKGLEQQQLWKLRTEIHRVGNLMHICIFELLLGTGIRVSELVNIKLSDIQISQRKGAVTVIGKGEAKRTVPLKKDIRQAIQNYMKNRRNEGEFLLVGQRGKLNRNAVNLILQKYADRLGIKITPHMLRHTLGHGLVKRNIPITTIQQILGHENIQTTQIYTMTCNRDMEEALEGVEW
jgi:integrase/recombinase XerC